MLSLVASKSMDMRDFACASAFRKASRQLTAAARRRDDKRRRSAANEMLQPAATRRARLRTLLGSSTASTRNLLTSRARPIIDTCRLRPPSASSALALIAAVYARKLFHKWSPLLSPRRCRRSSTDRWTWRRRAAATSGDDGGDGDEQRCMLAPIGGRRTTCATASANVSAVAAVDMSIGRRRHCVRAHAPLAAQFRTIAIARAYKSADRRRLDQHLLTVRSSSPQ